jgi:hypothetical protein
VDQQRASRSIAQSPRPDGIRVEGRERAGGHASEYMDRPRDARCYRRPPWARR